MFVHFETHSRFVCFFQDAKVARAGIERGSNHRTLRHAKVVRYSCRTTVRREGRIDMDLAVVFRNCAKWNWMA
jgi:hypothetical protein